MPAGPAGPAGLETSALQEAQKCAPRLPLGTYQLIPVDPAFLLLGYPAKDKQKYDVSLVL